MGVAREKQYRIPEQSPDSVALKYTKRQIDKARDMYYPGWWATGSLEGMREHLKPLYIVRDVKGEERSLAEAAKPPLVRAEIVNS